MPGIPTNNAGLKLVFFLIFLLLCGYTLYSPVLKSQTFYFDDRFTIADNPSIYHIDIPKLFDAFNTRFLVGLSFAINYQFCGLHPEGYRIINIFIHCLNALLVYLLIRLTLDLRLAGSSVSGRRIETAAGFASLMFLCHPIQTEAVNYITQRFVLMAAFFYLLALIFYIQYRTLSQKRFLYAGILAALAAMFCKEFAVTLPFMMVMYEFYFFQGKPLARIMRLLPFFAVVLIVPILLLKTPSQTVGVADIADSNLKWTNIYSKVRGHVDITKAHLAPDRGLYFLTELNVVRDYIKLLFWPLNQNAVYDYPLSLGTFKDLCSGLFLLSILLFAWFVRRRYPLVSFGIYWFFLALSVESSFIPIGHVIAEYRVYLAAVGFVLLVTNMVFLRKTGKKPFYIAAGGIIVACSILTYLRNELWKDEIVLLNDSIKKSPYKALLYNNRGYLQDLQGKGFQAIADYSKAIDLLPDYVAAYSNRGWVYFNLGNDFQALTDYDKAIGFKPSFGKPYNNRAYLYFSQGKFNEAISDFNTAIAIDPTHADTFYNCAVAYLIIGKINQALSDLNRAIELDPTQALYYYERGRVYNVLGRWPQAIEDFNNAIEINSHSADLFNGRGGVYYKLGDYAQAIADYHQALALNPKRADTYFNLGLVYNQLEEFQTAVDDFNKALSLDPHHGEIFMNRAEAYFKLKNYQKAFEDLQKAQQSGLNNPALRKALNQKFKKHYDARNKR